MPENLLGGPAPTYLPEDHPDAIARADIAAGRSAADAAAATPSSSYAWAVLAREAFAAHEVVAAYAYARTGYHRGLDALRRTGWKGHGLIPASHVPNQGFLMCLVSLAEAAAAIGEEEEALRCRTFAVDSDPDALNL